MHVVCARALRAHSAAIANIMLTGQSFVLRNQMRASSVRGRMGCGSACGVGSGSRALHRSSGGAAAAPWHVLRRNSSSTSSTAAATPQAAAAAAAATAEPATATAADPAGAGHTATAQRKRVLSGVQPTGKLHLGNYMGAIKNWVPLQDDYDTFFCVVDLHAITVQHDPAELRAATRSMAAAYLAAGIDPSKASIFVQSHVSAHAELSWLLECTAPMGWLQRMIQFKEKARKQGEDVRAGLLTYPVLMAADILLYSADLVPVGDDQKQHLELTRDIAERVNHVYGGKAWKKRGGRGGRVLKVPEPFIPPAGARIMSLQDGTAKMSKSAENDASRINLTDDAAAIAAKIKRCKTDAVDGLEYDNPDRPEANNLLTLYQLATGRTKAEVAAECAAMRWGTFKPLLADALVEHLRPIQERYQAAASEPGYLDGVLAAGAEAAAATANETLARVRDAMGFVPPLRKY